MILHLTTLCMLQPQIRKQNTEKLFHNNIVENFHTQGPLSPSLTTSRQKSAPISSPMAYLFIPRHHGEFIRIQLLPWSPNLEKSYASISICPPSADGQDDFQKAWKILEGSGFEQGAWKWAQCFPCVQVGHLLSMTSSHGNLWLHCARRW